MTKQDKALLILQEVDSEYSVPTYVEARVLRGIEKALHLIEEDEKWGKDDKGNRPHP